MNKTKLLEAGARFILTKPKKIKNLTSLSIQQGIFWAAATSLVVGGMETLWTRFGGAGL